MFKESTTTALTPNLLEISTFLDFLKSGGGGGGGEALAIRRIFSLVDMITKAKFSNSPNDFKIRLFR